MSFDWTPLFCLGCEKQTNGAAYCSETCRLSEYESTSSTPSSGASSPALSGPALEWRFSKPTMSTSKIFLSPALPLMSTQSSSLRRSSATLSPSASHTSLCSIRSSSSAGLESTQLSDKAARELRAYAHSFESARIQRRRSY